MREWEGKRGGVGVFLGGFHESPVSSSKRWRSQTYKGIYIIGGTEMGYKGGGGEREMIMLQKNMEGYVTNIRISTGSIVTASSVGSIKYQVLENNLDVINQVSRKKMIVWGFYIKYTGQLINVEGTLYYCVSCHRKEPIIRKYYAKGIVRYTNTNTSRLQNYLTSNHQWRYSQFVEYIHRNRDTGKASLLYESTEFLE